MSLRRNEVVFSHCALLIELLWLWLLGCGPVGRAALNIL